MGAKLSNLFSREKKKIDQTAFHWSDKSDKYIVRTMGIHNPTRGIVYRKTRVKRSTFNDPKWQKKYPKMHKIYSSPVGKKQPPLDIYSPASKTDKQIKEIQSKPSYKKRYSWS